MLMNFDSMPRPNRLAIQILYILTALCCLCLPLISSAYALALGLVFGLGFGNPFFKTSKAVTHRFLTTAVIGLGLGMDLIKVANVGSQGFLYTLIGIVVAIGCGLLLGKLLQTPRNTSMLISVGTAICGGSAIASVAPVLRAKPHEISIALGIVFLLNSIALVSFPHIGHYFLMSQEQFGLWAALAIHDTSSVVGASLAYGDQALAIGTTVKLARALWIVPVTLMVGFVVSRQSPEASGQEGKRKYPWFILGFLIAAAIYTWVPMIRDVAHVLEMGAKRLLILTLFLIGSNITREVLRGMGFKPVLQGVSLWLISAGLSLFAILQNWIHL
jgi:uncharacterized integral membrane protein (TIGR00698 family)